MTTPRDPRKDPRVGDVLRTGEKFNRVYHEVTETGCQFNDIYVDSSDGRGELRWSLSQFREWMANAEVLHAAD